MPRIWINWEVVGQMVGLMLLYGLAFSLVMWFIRRIIRVIAMQVFGWRPDIFNKELAKEIAGHSIREAIRRDEAISKIMNDELRCILEHYSYWVIESYTAAFSFTGPKPDLEPPRIYATESFTPPIEAPSEDAASIA